MAETALVDQRIYNRRGDPPPPDHVLTPGGYRHKALVRRIGKGFYLRRRKNEIQLVERRTSRIHTRGPVPDPSFLHPQIGSGWITFAEWNRRAATTIKRIYTEWIVPDLPAAGDSGQTVFLFNGLQNDSRDEIVQPVLQYGLSAAGGGVGWWIGNWWVASSGIAVQNGLQAVNPGDTVTGVVTLISQPNGKFTYVSQFVNYPDLDVTASETDELSWVCHTLEAYQIRTDNDYPSSPYTSMKSIEIDLEGSNLDQIPWNICNPYLAEGQRSNVRVAVYNDSVGLDASTGIDDYRAVAAAGWSFDAFGDIDFHGDLLAKAVSPQVSPFGNSVQFVDIKSLLGKGR